MQQEGHTSVDLGLEDPMDCPFARIISVETLGVLGFTGSLIVKVDPLPVPHNKTMAGLRDSVRSH